MLVKCKACGNKIERNEAYKVVLNNKNNYYCNEQEYKKVQIEKESRMKVMEEVKEILGDTTNTIIFRELSDITKVHGYHKLLLFLNENKSGLKGIMNKSFNNEFGKIRYFFTIIKNKIGDFKEAVKEDNNIKNLEHTTIKYKAKGRKKSLNEYLNDYFKEVANNGQ